MFRDSMMRLAVERILSVCSDLITLRILRVGLRPIHGFFVICQYEKKYFQEVYVNDVSAENTAVSYNQMDTLL
jgi:hypothetical protein